jgi:hypothetical protein
MVGFGTLLKRTRRTIEHDSRPFDDFSFFDSLYNMAYFRTLCLIDLPPLACRTTGLMRHLTYSISRLLFSWRAADSGSRPCAFWL